MIELLHVKKMILTVSATGNRLLTLDTDVFRDSDEIMLT